MAGESNTHRLLTARWLLIIACAAGCCWPSSAHASDEKKEERRIENGGAWSESARSESGWRRKTSGSHPQPAIFQDNGVIPSFSREKTDVRLPD